MGVLKALVGDRFLPQLKIAVVPNGHGQTVDTDLIRTLQGPGSPFHAVHAGGAEIVGLPLRAENIREFLLGYIQLPYLLLKIQNQITHGNVGPPREYITKLFERTSTTSLERSPRSRRGAARASNHPHDTNLAEAAERSQQLELALAESEAEIKLLRDQFQQIRSEYASLRSELQLNDNMEQGNIVQCLKDLNRCIGNLGRSIAEHIVDHYIPSYADDDTTLKASDLSRVKAQFHHQEGRPSLVVSSSGDGMPAEDFFDHGIRSIVCKRLYENIFLPFHPILLGDPRNDFMNELYQEVRYQDNQTAASKWRANSFLAVSKNNDSEVRTQHIRTHVENIKTQDFAGLFAGFFDEDTNVSLEGSHDEELERLVSLAWDWNHILKGSVVMLGDFQPTVYDNGVPFDPSCMADFEPKKGSKKVPQTALCTIGLGLKVSRSKVKGSAVDDTIICKASVVTEHIYE
ncbi:hypothetical protein FRC07_003746 [Ceratobasidium sp. 392]|nr:hypothetical protein FRC07_003746 [Ceratobasidium sp. 392]